MRSAAKPFWRRFLGSYPLQPRRNSRVLLSFLPLEIDAQLVQFVLDTLLFSAGVSILPTKIRKN
jgi:hypothetical protein